MEFSQDELMYQSAKASIELCQKKYEHITTVVIGAGRTACKVLDYIHKTGLHKNYLIGTGSEGTILHAQSLDLEIIDPFELEGGTYIYIDGADQICKGLIKGGMKVTKNGFECSGNQGIEGCMYREKSLANRSEIFIVVADESKVVNYLGENKFPLPIEIKPKDEIKAKAFLLNRGFHGKIRTTEEGNLFVNENDNLIYDAGFDGRLHDLSRLEEMLERGLGKEHGIFSTGLFAINQPRHILISSTQGVFPLEEFLTLPKQTL